MAVAAPERASCSDMPRQVPRTAAAHGVKAPGPAPNAHPIQEGLVKVEAEVEVKARPHEASALSGLLYNVNNLKRVTAACGTLLNARNCASLSS